MTLDMCYEDKCIWGPSSTKLHFGCITWQKVWVVHAAAQLATLKTRTSGVILEIMKAG